MLWFVTLVKKKKDTYLVCHSVICHTLSVSCFFLLPIQWFKLGANISNFTLSPSTILFHIGHAGKTDFYYTVFRSLSVWSVELIECNNRVQKVRISFSSQKLVLFLFFTMKYKSLVVNVLFFPLELKFYIGNEVKIQHSTKRMSLEWNGLFIN